MSIQTRTVRIIVHADSFCASAEIRALNNRAIAWTEPSAFATSAERDALAMCARKGWIVESIRRVA
jgi:hypothetical protein